MKKEFGIVVRVFVEASEEKAKQLADDLVNLFQKPVTNLEIESYYKEPGWYEISFWLKENMLTQNEALKQLTQKLGSGWKNTFFEEEDDYTSYSIWDYRWDGKFIIPEARFANLELFLP